MEIPEFKCDICGKAVSQADLESQNAGQIDKKIYCNQHYRELIRKAALDTQIIDEKDNVGKEE